MKECLICKKVYGDHVERCDRDRSPVKLTLPGPPLIADRYRLEQRIGQGSLGMVYRGLQVSSNNQFAIKIISPEYVHADPNCVMVFFDEADAVMVSQHPHIVRVFDYGKSPADYLYLVMEYLEGCTLKALIEQEPEIPIERVINLMLQISDAVTTMHKQGRLHRNLKPSNIFVVYGDDDSERIKLLDFGIDRIKSVELCSALPGAITHNLLDPPYYLAPEQCNGQELDGRSEVYSLGVIFYQLLTGKVPFTGKNVSILEQHIHQPPLPPRSLRHDIPEAIETIVLRALAKHPKDRFHSPSALLMLLKMAMLPSSKTTTATLVSNSSAPLVEMAREERLQPAAAQSKFHDHIPGRSTGKLGKEFLEKLENMLLEKLSFSHFLTHADLDPGDVIEQIAEQFRRKNMWQDGVNYVPHLVKISVVRTSREKFEELEEIFNSIPFLNHLYKYAGELGYKLFGLLKIEMEMIEPKPGRERGCVLSVEWPQPSEVSNGLEKIIQVKQEQVTTSNPLIKIPRVALLQSINAAAYQDY
ncbi:MAG: serine/threonine-protein kinase, partial [Acidobacteriota bacterium]